MILTARDLLTEHVLRVPAEARAAAYERELATGRLAAFAVFDDEAFLGLVEPATVAAFPPRIFADLCSDTAPIAETTPLDLVLREMEQRGTTLLPVVTPEGQFLGAVSYFRITELLRWQAESRLQGIRQLLATTVDLGSGRRLDDVLQRVVELAVELTDARNGVLELFDDEALVSQRFLARPGAPLPGTVARPPRVAQGAPGLADDAGTRDQDGTPLVIALCLRDHVLGRLSVWDKGRTGRFTGEDQVLLAALADQAAIAVENARLFASLTRQTEELRHTQAQLLQAEKLGAMGQLLASVAHELSNPLAVLLGQSDLLAHALAGTTHATPLQQISTAAQRCARIVRNYLALARQRPPQRTVVDLNAVIRDALELLIYALRVDGVEVTLELADGLAPVAGDPHQLHQVVVNLVTNARDALREVAPPRRLRLATRQDGPGSVYLEVTDSGPGIPPEVRHKVFEPFFTTKPAGTGLGLSLCQSIVDSHHGTIEVDSQVGAGTTFRVRLTVTARSGTSDAPLDAEGTSPITGRRILVVDDEPVIRELLADILAEDQHAVEMAGDGQDALEKLERTPYDLILLDVRMPGVDGLQLYRTLAARRPELAPRFIFVTGDTLNPAVHAVLDRSDRLILKKPFTATEARDLVRRALRAVDRTPYPFRPPPAG